MRIVGRTQIILGERKIKIAGNRKGKKIDTGNYSTKKGILFKSKLSSILFVLQHRLIGAGLFVMFSVLDTKAISSALPN
jgi:hypothetical protein